MLKFTILGLVAIVVAALFMGGVFLSDLARTSVPSRQDPAAGKERTGRPGEIADTEHPSRSEVSVFSPSNLSDNEAEFLRRLRRNGVASEKIMRVLAIRRALEETIAALEREHSIVREAGNRIEVEVAAFPTEAGRAIDQYVSGMKEVLGAPVPDDLLYGDAFERSALNGGLFEKRIVVTEKWNGSRFDGYEFSVETFIPNRAESQSTTTVRGTASTVEELWSRDPALKAHFRPSR